MKPQRVWRLQNSSCRIETGNRKSSQHEHSLGQIDAVLQTNQIYILCVLEFLPNALVMTPIYFCHKQCCFTNINQHTKQNQSKQKKQTKSINVDLVDGISAQPGAHIPPPYFVSKHCFKAILIFLTAEPSYITIYKSCSIHGHSEWFSI